MSAVEIEHFVGTPRQAIDKMPRTDDRSRLFSAAIANLHFHHPYKHFGVAFDIRTQKDENGNPTEIHPVSSVQVLDFGVVVAEFTMYRPQGDTRDKPQLEIEYNYFVHEKEPRKSKRTSNYAKIPTLIKMIKPAFPVDIVNEAPGHMEIILESSGYEKARRSAKDLLQKFYYGDVDEKMNLLKDLANGRETAGAQAFKQSLSDVDKDYATGRSEYEAYLKQVVFVGKNSINDRYMVVRVPLNKDGTISDRHEIPSHCYESKDQLPEDVLGLVSVMEISLSALDNGIRANVDGVGRARRTNRGVTYTLIGKDFNDINAREEGKDQGI